MLRADRGAGALALAALLADDGRRPGDEVAIQTGGNIDADTLGIVLAGATPPPPSARR